MRFPLQDRVVIITGASTGIGAVLAEQCARKKAKVVVAARSAEKLETLAQKIRNEGGQVLVIPTDVTKPANVSNLISLTLKTWGAIDVLVNNAGYGLWSPIDQLPLEEIRKNFETNVFAAMACFQAVLPQMKKQGKGLIVNVESIVGLRAMPESSCYSATKHALHAFSEATRLELAPHGIHVLSVCPGLIETEFHKNRVQIGIDVSTGPESLYVPVELCASQMVRAMERGKRQLVVSWHAKALAAIQRLSPGLLDAILTFYRKHFEKNS